MDDDLLKPELKADFPPRLKPVVLLLLDGFAVAPANEGNAISSAKTTTISQLIKNYPVALLEAGKGNINARYLSLGLGRDITDENSNFGVTAASSSLAAVISSANRRQLKISETLRFAALSNFFNGCQEEKFPGEDLKIISSVVKERKIKPGLISNRIFKELLSELEKPNPADFIVVAVPAIDLSAAQGDFEATKKIITAIDSHLKKVIAKILAVKADLLISSACGNAERMLDLGTELSDNNITANPVPLIIIGEQYKGKTIGLADPVGGDLSLLTPAGTLADLAPTILAIMGLEKPAAMTGKSLVENL
jgi:bisphosphoglycerate-independent phosphoglycerate mutase (AlkP superfamily)